MAEKLLSKRLKELRRLNNFTQDYVASSLGVIRQTYSHYETGKRIPSTEILYKLASLYKIPFEDLVQLSLEIDRNEYYEVPEPACSSKEMAAMLEYYDQPNQKKKYQYHTSLEKELLYYFQQISDHDKREIIEFVKIKVKNRNRD